MSKKARNYEQEIEEAAKRMEKHKESLKTSWTSKTFYDFLDSIGVNPATYESKKGLNFWEQVRSKIQLEDEKQQSKILEDKKQQLISQMVKANVERVSGLYRDAKGRYTATPTDKPITSYRDKKTGRFTSFKA